MGEAGSPWQPLNTARRSPALEILLHGPLSRVELAHRLDLSAATLTRLTKPLIDSGLVRQMPSRREPSTGRPRLPLDVVPTRHHFIGVRLTAEHAYAVVTDLRARVVGAADRPIPDPSPCGVVETVAGLVAALAADGHRVTGLGVGVGGLTVARREVRRAGFLGWEAPVPLAELLEERTVLPTTVDNDLLALTKAEHWFGAGRGHPHFALITTGVGIGYGLVVHDQLVETSDAGVGLLQHYPLEPGGPPCPVGHPGCALAMLSTPALTQRVSDRLGRPVGYPEVLELAAAGEPGAAEQVQDAARALGRLVAAVANLTLAPLVIISGEGAGLATVAARTLRRSLEVDRDPLTRPIDLVVQPLDTTRWARGAAVSAIQAHVDPAAGGATGGRQPAPAPTRNMLPWRL